MATAPRSELPGALASAQLGLGTAEPFGLPPLEVPAPPVPVDVVVVVPAPPAAVDVVVVVPPAPPLPPSLTGAQAPP